MTVNQIMRRLTEAENTIEQLQKENARLQKTNDWFRKVNAWHREALGSKEGLRIRALS